MLLCGRYFIVMLICLLPASCAKTSMQVPLSSRYVGYSGAEVGMP